MKLPMTHLPVSNVSGITALIIVALCYAAIGIPIRFLDAHFTLLQQMSFWIFFSAVLALLLFHKHIRVSFVTRTDKKDLILIFLRAILFYAIGTLLYIYGITHAKYSNVALINAIPSTALLGIILLGEAITPKKTMAIIASIIGTLFITVKDFSSNLSLGFGEIATVGSLFFYGLSYILRKWQSKDLNNYEITAIILVIASIVSVIMTFIFDQKLPQINFTLQIVAAIGVIALINTLMTFLVNFGFEKIEAVTASMILNLETVFGIIISVLLYLEVPNIKEIIGGFLIIFAAVMVKKTKT